MRTTTDRLGISVLPLQRSPGFFRCELNGELKVDFVIHVAFRVGEPTCIDGLMIDSIDNIAVNKVCAILGRLDAKDYVDLFLFSISRKIAGTSPRHGRIVYARGPRWDWS